MKLPLHTGAPWGPGPVDSWLYFHSAPSHLTAAACCHACVIAYPFLEGHVLPQLIREPTFRPPEEKGKRTHCVSGNCGE